MSLVDYIVIKGDVPTNIIPADGPFDLGDARFTMVPYDPDVHDATRDPGFNPPAFVNKKEFLFELFTTEERAILLRQFKIADTMANWPSDSPDFTEGLYRALVDAKENLDTISRVDISHVDTTAFLTLCGYLAVFGADPANQAARITSIVIGRRPDGTYLEE